MTEVVSIKFRNRGKTYFFDPAGVELAAGGKAVVETSKGLEIGTVVQGNHTVEDDQVVQPLRPVARAATEDDLRIEELCRQREREAYEIGKQKIEAHGLEMKLVDVECSFEGTKIIFFFSSEGRVDFRDLVKDLAGVFRTRIELRQIGVRDEARMLGGLGICGRPFCCGSFMDEFKPVSTKMAKIQNLSLNPAKISGCCGRLMCCLRYEQPAYEELVKNVPKNGAFVETPDGYGNVNQVNILRQTVRVKLDGDGDDAYRQYDVDEVAAVPGGRPRDGSQPPHILVLKPKKAPEPEVEEDPWQMPELIVDAAAAVPPAVETGGEKRPERSRRPRREGGQSAEPPAEGGGKRRQGRSNRRGGQGRKEPKPAERQPKAPEQGRNRSAKPPQRPKTEGPAPQEQSQKTRSKNYYNRRRPHNRRPKSEGGQNKE